MGFRINNNISALVAQSNLLKNQNSLTTSIERLSSGLRINRGADDAAGLTISEKLRGQIKGLNRAVLNAQDGISLIQTAEGALNEDATILNRIRELTIQSSNDTLTTNDRLEIQREVDQLVDEMDRIANATEFNTKKLLDGTATAIVSVNAEGLDGLQVGSTLTSSGDYTVEIVLSSRGVRQEQASNILKQDETGNLATEDTTLGELESFYDNERNPILRDPVTLTIRGNSNATNLTLSSDITINELVSQVKEAITTDERDGGLGIKGADVSFNSRTGQINISSGLEGFKGDISFASDEDLIKAFGFQETIASEDPAYKATATQQGVTDPIVSEASTTTDRFSGVIPGVDLQFQPATSAFIEGDLNPVDVIKVGDTDITFTFADTNAEQSEAIPADPVSVTLLANRTYSLVSVQDIINTNVQTGIDMVTGLRFTGDPDGTYNPPNIRASFRGDDLILTAGVTGTSSRISIYGASTSATNILGIQNGVFLGNGGEKARIVGNKDVSTGFTTGNTTLSIEIIGPDNRSSGTSNTPGGRIDFPPNSNISATSLTEVITNQLRSQGILGEAVINANGSLVIQSMEDGEDTNLIVNLISGNLSELGMVSGVSARGTRGAKAEFVGNTNESFFDFGYTFDTTVRFDVSDQFGASSGDIVFASTVQGGVEVATDNNITVSSTSIEAILNASNLNTTDVTFEFDQAGRLQFASKSVGESARILITAMDPRFGQGTEPVGFTASTTQTTLLNTLGIDVSQAAQGTGKTKYAVHVADRSFSLQIGANENQTLESSIANFKAAALGLKGIDITNFASAVKALGSVDRAVNTVSSERSKLGSLQNRLTSTINNLTVTTTNLQAAESRIRDVDIAVETVDFTRTQILIQAGTAQLAQANALPQQALQLLGG